MVYMSVKEDTAQKLHLCREPSSWSWCILIGVIGGGLGAMYYGTDHFLWRFICFLGALMLGFTSMDDWEECTFDRQTCQVTLRKRSLLQRLVYPLWRQHVVVATLDDIIDVRVEGKDLRYLGTGHQAVLLLASGVILGITDSFTMGSNSDHYAVAEKIKCFLGLCMSQRHDGDAYLGDSSSSDDSFEQITSQDLIQESVYC